MMLGVLVAIGATLAGPAKLPRTVVEQARNWPVVATDRVRLGAMPPVMQRVEVRGRGPKLREWRDAGQRYAVFGTAQGYVAAAIRFGRYEVLADELAGGPVRHASLADACVAINADWQALQRR